MTDDKGTLAYAADHTTVDEVGAFIDELTNEYKFLAIFVFVTAVAPETAISLDVATVNSRIAKLGDLGALQSLSNVPIHRDLELLLPVFIRGRRAAFLKRKNIPASEEPPQVYLDRNARPFTLDNVNAAFLRLSRKLGLPIPIKLETIAWVVAKQSMLERLAMPQHEPSPCRH
ncbi:hypothetical protein LZK82_16780 [Rhizobium leguminosarum]|nr:hypothetical protein LZK82_16780 [Rhizobium leguminosarum]UIK09672.1 hypothetical protein LZK80_16910 [Rhizobium leguminosarum]UIL26852.1 hypothetical protein LZK75_16905 [Rhizobium leguminosarum]